MMHMQLRDKSVAFLVLALRFCKISSHLAYRPGVLLSEMVEIKIFTSWPVPNGYDLITGREVYVCVCVRVSF
jgi:hypothetical protein